MFQIYGRQGSNLSFRVAV